MIISVFQMGSCFSHASFIDHYFEVPIQSMLELDIFYFYSSNNNNTTNADRRPDKSGIIIKIK